MTKHEMQQNLDNYYLSFLTLITDMMTRRLPKMAAIIINIIIDAVKTLIKTLIQS